MAVTTQTTADRCRHRFSIFERLVYANSCSQGALSDHVRAAYDRYFDDWERHGSPWDIWGGGSSSRRDRHSQGSSTPTLPASLSCPRFRRG